VTAAESRWLATVKSLPCVICMFRLGGVNYEVDVHHCGERRNHFYVAALCKEHHQGATGVHGLHRRAFNTLWKASDEHLVAWTIQLHIESGHEPPVAF